jgi:N-acetylneuraminic acid mutarotase
MMIVWGGHDGTSAINTGSRFDPIANTWRPTKTTGAPSKRSRHGATWTGTEMVVWGGFEELGTYTNSGKRYNPVNDLWSDLNGGTPPSLSGRAEFSMVTMASKTYVFGGRDAGNIYNDGAYYDHTLDVWQNLNATNPSPVPRYSHSAAVAGTTMVIWGGRDATNYLNDGGRYDDGVTWNSSGMTTTNAPTKRAYHAYGVISGLMYVWGGFNGTVVLNDGKSYDPINDTWLSFTGTATPSAVYAAASIATERELVLFGGRATDGTLINSGAHYIVP